MKTLLLSLVLFLSFLSFSQKIVIEIFERQELVSYRNTTLDSVIMNPDVVNDLEVTKTTYVIDLNENTSSYFVDGEFLSVLPVDVVRAGDGLFVVKILEEGFDYGLIVNIGNDGDNVLWYWNTEQMTTVKKMTKFNILKSL
jgi:hypothetical protein